MALTLGDILVEDVGVEECVFPVAVDLEEAARLLDVLRHAEEGELLVRQTRRQSHHLHRRKKIIFIKLWSLLLTDIGPTCEDPALS